MSDLERDVTDETKKGERKSAFSIVFNLPAGWAEVPLNGDEIGDIKWAPRAGDKVYQLVMINTDLWVTFSDEKKQDYGIDRRDELNMMDSRTLCEAYEEEASHGEFLGFSDVDGLRFAAYARDAEREVDEMGLLPMRLVEYRTIHRGISFIFCFYASDFEDADRAAFEDILGGLVVTGDGPGYQEKDDMRPVSFEKDGHTVAMEIPCDLLMVPHDESL